MYASINLMKTNSFMEQTTIFVIQFAIAGEFRGINPLGQPVHESETNSASTALGLDEDTLNVPDGPLDSTWDTVPPELGFNEADCATLKESEKRDRVSGRFPPEIGLVVTSVPFRVTVVPKVLPHLGPNAERMVGQFIKSDLFFQGELPFLQDLVSP